jgi:hypothetical protein
VTERSTTNNAQKKTQNSKKNTRMTNKPTKKARTRSAAGARQQHYEVIGVGWAFLLLAMLSFVLDFAPRG